MKKIKTTILILATLLFGISCQSNKRDKKNKDKPTIVVSIEPLRYFTESIAGNNFNVISLIPKGMSPETYDITPQQLITIQNSVAYFRIGYIGFEQTWMERIKSSNPSLKIINTSNGLNLIHDSHHHHAHNVEPHVWNSPTNAEQICKNIYEALVSLDKEHAGDYHKRLEETEKKIHEVKDSIAALLKGKEINSNFMIYHPALTYFAKEYKLNQYAIEEEDKEPSAKHLKELIKTAKEKKIKILFLQPEFDKKHAQVIAKQVGITIVPIEPLSYHWDKEMIRVAKAIAEQK